MSDNNEPTPTPQPEPEPKVETKAVDVFGVTLDLPKEQADKIIAVRDEKVKQYNEVLSERERATLEAQEAKRKADALEAAKAGEAEKAEELFAQKYQEQISKYEQHSFRSAVMASLASRSDLVDGALEDAMNNIMANNHFTLTDDFQVVSGETTVEKLVSDYVEARPYLKKADTKKPMNAPKNAEAPSPVKKGGMDAIRNGLGKIVNTEK